MIDGSPLTNAPGCHTFLVKPGINGGISFSRKEKQIMLYFVKENTIHTFPVSKRCSAVKEKEQLRDTIPHGAEECPYCMHRWPDDKE